MRKHRYKLMLGEKEIGTASSIGGLGKLIGCTYQHIYAEKKTGNTFFYKKNNYTIIDKLDF